MDAVGEAMSVNIISCNFQVCNRPFEGVRSR
jgi:hypothetical protein